MMTIESMIPLRIGLCGDLIPVEPDTINERTAHRITDLGFAGVTVHLGAGRGIAPGDLDSQVCRRVRDLFDAHGVRVVQSWAFGANHVHPDREGRRRELARLGDAMRVAADLGADAVIGGCGSLNPSGAYAPHRDNHGRATRKRLVASLEEAAARAQEFGVPLALECHVLTTLDTPEHMRDILEAVDSPYVRANLDPANFVGDLVMLR